ncbi:MAG TPA: pyridoxamine 5'-phosphate oxidase family protein, partial [Deltaproteobacteria bacterium]|nr:pyridoxamine 5'-phosphate oxidase family protein [Deltaproteobacteria bacterium]
MKQTRNSFSDDEIKAFAPSEKIAIVATVSDDNSPHLTLLTSLMAAAPDRVVIGQFCTGESKANMAARPD